MGLWHGAAWSYAVWGLAHGLALAVERFFEGKNKKKSELSFFRKILKGSFVFLYVTFAWLLFKLPKFDEVIYYLKCISTNYNKPTDYAGLIFFYMRIFITSSNLPLLLSAKT